MAMKKKYGQVAEESPFFQRVAKSLMTAPMVGKVAALLDSSCPLHGVSDSNVGIEECRKVFLELGRASRMFVFWLRSDMSNC